MSENNQKISYFSTQGELFSLSPVHGKQIVVDFASPEVFSLGGLLLMRESEFEVGILSSLRDKRNPLLIHHTYNGMMIQRVFQTASGYEDAMTVMQILMVISNSHSLINTMESITICPC